MTEPSLFSDLPPMRLLRVFEAAARHGNFSIAAGELHTTQSSVSRAVAELERGLDRALFERLHRGVRLTAAGEMYLEAVTGGLARIGAMGRTLATRADGHVVITCGHATAAMFLMPLRETLYRKIGGGLDHIHLLICDYELLDRVNRDEVDVILAYDTDGAAPADRAVAFREEVTPVCSPAYAARHADVLDRPVAQWGALTFLHLERPSRGWTTWEDWFEVAGRPRTEPLWRGFSDYVFLIEDAVDGHGLALGWRRFVDRRLERGTLVAPRIGFTTMDGVHWAVLTERGRRRPLARQCLDAFDELSRRADET